MRWVLWIAGTYNIASGLGMLVGYHEVYRLLAVPKPASVLPLQMLGVMIALFGVGFFFAASDPLSHRLMILLGLWAKLAGFVLGAAAVVQGDLPGWFVVAVFFADLIYVPPLWVILRFVRNAEPKSAAD